jgi:hypothetical protein
VQFFFSFNLVHSIDCSQGKPIRTGNTAIHSTIRVNESTVKKETVDVATVMYYCEAGTCSDARVDCRCTPRGAHRMHLFAISTVL